MGWRGDDWRFSILALRESPAARGAFGLALRHRRAQAGWPESSELSQSEGSLLADHSLAFRFPGRGGRGGAGPTYKLEGFMYG